MVTIWPPLTGLPLLTVKIGKPRRPGHGHRQRVRPGPNISMLLLIPGTAPSEFNVIVPLTSEIDHVIGSAGIGRIDRFAQTAIGIARAVVRVVGSGHDQRRVDVARLAFDAPMSVPPRRGVRNRTVVSTRARIHITLIGCRPAEILPLVNPAYRAQNLRRGRATLVASGPRFGSTPVMLCVLPAGRV